MSTYDLEKLEANLIYFHKPLYNKEYKHETFKEAIQRKVDSGIPLPSGAFIKEAEKKRKNKDNIGDNIGECILFLQASIVSYCRELNPYETEMFLKMLCRARRKRSSDFKFGTIRKERKHLNRLIELKIIKEINKHEYSFLDNDLVEVYSLDNNYLIVEFFKQLNRLFVRLKTDELFVLIKLMDYINVKDEVININGEAIDYHDIGSIVEFKKYKSIINKLKKGQIIINKNDKCTIHKDYCMFVPCASINISGLITSNRYEQLKEGDLL